MKALGLDLGDVWIGIALSDALKLSCKPYKTIKKQELYPLLTLLLETESIDTIIIGHPKTMKGEKSLQTKKIEQEAHHLEQWIHQKKEWATITVILWDERLSSKWAQETTRLTRKKRHKTDEHSIAACYILQGYLDARIV